MDDKPSGAWFWYFIGIWGLLGVALIMLGTGTAKAQEQLCAPASQVLPTFAKEYDEMPVWEGATPTPQGLVETILLQSPKGTWSLFVIRGGIACLTAAGKDGTPIEREQPGEDA